MYESLPYRDELAQFARLFAVRRKRQSWRDDSVAKSERALFVGFLYVRKLIECKKVTDECAKSSTEIGRIPIRRTREVSDFQRDDILKDLAHVEWLIEKVDVHQLADNIIHTWWILPIRGDAHGLEGFFFTTARYRNKEIWYLPTESIVKVFRRFSRGAINSLHKKRDRQGRLVFWEAK